MLNLLSSFPHLRYPCLLFLCPIKTFSFISEVFCATLFSAVFCGFLRFSAVFCGFLRFSAVFCGGPGFWKATLCFIAYWKKAEFRKIKETAKGVLFSSVYFLFYGATLACISKEIPRQRSTEKVTEKGFHFSLVLFLSFFVLLIL